MDRQNKRYFSFHYKAMKFMGFGKFHDPIENNFDIFPNKAYLVLSIVCQSIIIIYCSFEATLVYKRWNNNFNHNEQFFGIVTLGAHIFGLMKLFTIIKNNKIIQKIVRILEVDCREFYVDTDIENRAMSITKGATGFFLVSGEVTMGFMCVYTFIINTTKSNKSNTFPAYPLWNADENIPEVINFLVNSVSIIWIGTNQMLCDSLIVSIMVHISAKFKMVQHTVENVGANAVNILKSRLKETYVAISLDEEDIPTQKQLLMTYFSQDDFNKAMILSLKQAIKYHQIVIK